MREESGHTFYVDHPDHTDTVKKWLKKNLKSEGALWRTRILPNSFLCQVWILQDQPVVEFKLTFNDIIRVFE